MTIKTGRAEGVADVSIDHARCIACGLCVKVCKGGPLTMEGGQIRVDQSRYFGCSACGQCVTVCPQECIAVAGRDLFSADVIPLPPREARAGYESLAALMLGRRSVRNFSARPVSRAVIEQLAAAAATAPMGLPPSDVEILVFEGREVVQTFAADILAFMRSVRWFFSPVMRALLRPFIGAETAASFATFLAPALDAFLEQHDRGVDWLTYDAPLALYFYTSPYADPADPLIAATYAMLAGEALGLGSCMLGTIAHCFKYSKVLRAKYDIPQRSQQGIMVIFGYPAVSYRRSLRRRLAAVRFVGESDARQD